MKSEIQHVLRARTSRGIPEKVITLRPFEGYQEILFKLFSSPVCPCFLKFHIVFNFFSVAQCTAFCKNNFPYICNYVFLYVQFTLVYVQLCIITPPLFSLSPLLPSFLLFTYNISKFCPCCKTHRYCTLFICQRNRDTLFCLSTYQLVSIWVVLTLKLL